jgi:UDP-N-acetylmuramoylalanine--D-glutamate ligase
MEFYGKKILVLGMGKSGLSAAILLEGKGAGVTIADAKKEADIDPQALARVRDAGIKLELGPHRVESFTSADMIVVSPGVPLDLPVLKAAGEKGVSIIGELELASRLFDTPVIAVTGTNGKTTAVTLLGEMLKKSGFKVFIGGNIGTPAIDYAAGSKDCDYVLLEVSSFQLDTTEQFSPKATLILNITPDHLERYADYDAYVQSKLRIFKNQNSGSYAVLNDDDEALHNIDRTGNAALLRYGMEQMDDRRHAYMEDKRLTVQLPGREKKIFDTSFFLLPGRHNIENLMGVVLVALAAGVREEAIRDCISSFRGLPHRIEPVGNINSVRFYDDSKATNVDAAVRALGSFDRPVVLIAGGRHKGGEYLPLVEAARKRVKVAVLIGESKQLMADAFEGAIPYVFAEDMRDAVEKAASFASENDVVLLAPACSSFDMFTDYAHRGNVFKMEVERLKNVG